MRYVITNSTHKRKGNTKLLATLLAFLLASSGAMAQSIGGSVYGGGNKAPVTGPVTVDITGGEVKQNVFGGGNEAGILTSGENVGTTTVTIGNAKIGRGINASDANQYGIYGGCNSEGTVAGAIDVRIKGGTESLGTSTKPLKGIYGGGFGSATQTNDNVTVTVGYDNSNPTVYGDVYGGSALGKVNNSSAPANNLNLTKVDVKAGTVNGTVYGGGMGDNSNSALVNGNTQVAVSGTVTQMVYGGCNVNGTVKGGSTVGINGTINATNNTSAVVFGGGLGEKTVVNGAVAVTVGTGSIIHGDVHGGSAKGLVNCTVNNSTTPATITATSNTTTQVTLSAGAVNGNIYGGGLGQVSPTAIAADVYGPVTVDIEGGSVHNVFGGNNLKGSPKSSIEVDIAGGSVTQNVYGGGNQANAEVSTEVNVTGGTVTQDVYGGGALADVEVNTDVTLSGGSVRMAFGGGMGQLDDNTVIPALVATPAQVLGTAKVTVNSGSTVRGNYFTVGTGTDQINEKGAVFGGCNVNGSVSGKITVDAKGTIQGNVYGGGLGENTSTDAGVTVTIEGAEITGDVYGGSALGQVNDNTTDLTKVHFKSGSVSSNLYGGGMGEKGNDVTKGQVNGQVAVLVEGGSVQNVFGCNNYNGAPQGNVTVTVEKKDSGTWSVNNIYGGGNLASYSGPAPTSSRPNNPLVHIKNGTVTQDVFGGGLGATAKVLSNPKVTIGDATNGYSASAANVYGGGSAAEVGNSTTSATNNTDVLIQQNASVTKVFGGGKEAGVTGTSTVTISDGGVTTGIYGGCDSEGTVKGNIIVNVNGGTIGTESNLSNGTVAYIHGGGYGEDTDTEGDVTVTFGTLSNTHSDKPILYGELYGGSGYGDVNSTTGGNTTTVNIYNGNIERRKKGNDYYGGNVYGGGLGETGKLAAVNGVVHVNIGQRVTDPEVDTLGAAIVSGSVFGCNNDKGSPKDNVFVDVWRTNPVDNRTLYAIDQVFGGGNKADYNISNKKANVYIHGCDNSIRRVFGGGNAAAAWGVETTIDGGTFDYIFGGGNGEVSDADIYAGGATLTIMGGHVNQFFGGSNEHGTITGPLNVSATSGECQLEIGNFYCGSNKVEILGNVYTTITCNGGMTVTNLYGGSNKADIKDDPNTSAEEGNVSLTVEGGTYTNVFGGSKGDLESLNTTLNEQGHTDSPANIDGNVTLNLYGGTIENAFGGSDVYGNIGGKITVNVIDDESKDSDNKPTCPLILNNVYGGGRDAAYTPTASTALSPNFSPEVNIIHGTVSKKSDHTGGNVFGGGLGATAVVTANPKVGIGYASYMNIPDGITIAKSQVDVKGNVYGGGDLADVSGNTTVIVQRAEATANYTSAVGGNLFGGGNQADVSGSSAVTVSNGTVTGDVYGGGALADVNVTNGALTPGATTTVTLAGGTVHDIYGGGLGRLDDPATSPENEAVEAKVYGPVTVNINNGSVNDVYGCNNLNGAPQSTVQVNINNNVSGNVFGGGNVADYGNAPEVNVISGTVTGKVFGGGNEASVGGSAVTMSNGTVSSGVYGGCNASGDVSGAITVEVNGGTVGATGGESNRADVYGGGYGSGTTTSNDVTVTLQNNAVVYGDLYGGSAFGSVNASNTTTTVNLKNSNLHGSVYGGGKGQVTGGEITATTNGNVIVNIDAANTNGNLAGIYGGANINGNVVGDIDVYVNNNIGADGTNNSRNIFGGGLGAATTTGGDVTVTVGYGGTTPTIYGDVYGGSAMGQVNDPNASSANLTKVDFLNGTLHGTIYGGGMGQADGDSAIVNGNARVDVTNGTIYDGVYGGCNAKGGVTGNITVNANGGSIGTDADHRADVYGGGYGNTTATNGNVEVNINGATVWGDVYGGSGFGDVNKDGNNTTTVNILDGTVKRNVYGGGLGKTTPSYEALVNGVVIVNIGSGTPNSNATGGATSVSGNATIGGNVYGCNNTNGSPMNDVFVNVYQTAHTDDPNNNTSGNDFAIANVFGGGNKASYNATHHRANVTVYTCDNTISRVFGGGDAAGSEGAGVTIWGGRFHQVFGGGNGEAAEANIGEGGTRTTVHGGTIYQLFGGSNLQGSVFGLMQTNVYNDGGCGENITDFFGGANEALIAGNIETTIYCGTHFANVYGGSSKADIQGNVTLNIQGGTIGNVFGGSRGEQGHDPVAANIVDNPNTTDKVEGNVTLNIYGGIIGNAFGGSDQKGNIGGLITVNVLDHENDSPCEAFSLGNLYGSGNLTPYEPTNTGITNSPIVNVMHIRSSKSITGNVFGAGYGATAVVTANPKVTIGYNSSMVDYTNGFTMPGTTYVKVDGSVFGGGDAASVTGNTSVDLQTANSSINNLFGGGNEAGVDGTTQVNITGGSIAAGLYGGCNSAGEVTGDITVNVKSNLGANGAPMTEGIFGGGKGNATETSGNVTVTIDKPSGDNAVAPTLYADVYGGSAFGQVGATNKLTKVDLKAGTVNGTVYGGGKGQLAATTPVVLDAYAAEVTGATEVDINGNVTGGVYGGCNVNGIVKDNTTVNITGGTLGANANGGSVYGGGLGENTKVTGNVAVTVNGASAIVNGDVYGGSAKGLVNCTESGTASGSTTEVTLTAGTINGSFYGGGHGISGATANVFGPVAVKVNGGKVTGAVYGCNNAAGAPQSTVTVDVYHTDDAPSTSTYALANVFGGGNQAAYNGKPVVTIHNNNNSIEYVYGGGNAATVTGTDVTVYGGNSIGNVFGGCYGADVTTDGTNVKIRGGKIGKVFGGNNMSGSVTGNITINVNKAGDSSPGGTATACAMYVDTIFGGGNIAPSQAGSITIGGTGTFTNAHVSNYANIGKDLEGVGTVFGGANKANITSGSIVLTINDGIVGTVFGGNNISGEIKNTSTNNPVPIQVNINKTGSNGWYVGDVYGGGNKAAYGGTPDVNIIAGTVYRNVFGGGNNITGDSNETPKGVAASDVVMTGGTVLGGVYGGCNLKGTVIGNSEVKILSGTIGSQEQLNQGTIAQVFGGGLGEHTKVKGNVTVDFGEAPDVVPSPIASDLPKIYGDVYGGSALGSVNASSSNTTTVNILNGVLKTKTSTGTTSGHTYYIYNGGNVFGGGLGEVGSTSKGQVNGKVTVNIGAPKITRDLNPELDENKGNAIIEGNVYGGNNTSGAPQDAVTVNIYRTYRSDTDQITYVQNPGGPAPTFAIPNVFGGGNKASFPINSDKTVTVYIHGCYNSVERVFGGSNAAAAPNVHTYIEGGRFGEVFGGGNGEVSAANINGNVNLEIHGGIVDEFYVGSNQNGTISGTSNVTVDQTSGCEAVAITDFFCGGKYADFVGNIEATITCSQGMHVTNLYGGCKEANVVDWPVGDPKHGQGGNIHLIVNGGSFDNVYGGSKGKADNPNTTEDESVSADIEGNVTLDICGGSITKAIYGGSNVLGNIAGTITVNVEQGTGTDVCDLEVGLVDVYGGGNQADYNPTTTGDYPQVNIKNATVNNVFGGGFKAKVKGNPQIHLKQHAKVMGNVYGGGNMGKVEGSPRVIVNGKQVN